MTAFTDRCGAVDLDEHGFGTGAVCTAQPHTGKTHTDLSDPACMIQWGPAPKLTHRDESTLCWARSETREGSAWPVGCDRHAVSGGLCAAHAKAYGVVA